MGYETTLLIGSTHPDIGDKKEVYFRLDCTIDLCKIGESHLWELPWLNETPDETKWFWYAPTGDGDTQVYEDCYGDIPQPVNINDVIEALEEDSLHDDYRRFKWAIALLKAMAATGNYSVLFWSH